MIKINDYLLMLYAEFVLLQFRLPNRLLHYLFKYNWKMRSSTSTGSINEDMPISTNIIGIDLGTTFSSAAVFRNGKPEIIPNKQFGDHLTPSVVFYDPKNTDVSVGKFAEEWALTARSNFVYDTKRLMGRKYDDVYVQKIIENREYTYKIVKGPEDNAAIKVTQNNEPVQKLPEEIASEILKYLKESASHLLGETVTEAVISVPAHFSNAQRKATMKAAELAGITVLKLISEPVAAAIYYSIDKVRVKSTLLLFDLGGGTLDVSIVDVNDEEFRVRGLEGDSFLGGRDFDRNLQKHFFSSFLDNDDGEGNNSYNMRHLLRVKKACTKIKIMLSSREQAALTLDHFGRDRDDSLPLTVSREEFESLNETLFNRIMDLVKQCLADVNLRVANIDHVILVGGSSRIPKVRSLLASYFGENKIRTDVNPDEAIALGAAIQAAVLSTNDNRELEKYKVTEVAPLSIGVSVFGGVMEVGITKNSPLPARGTVGTLTSQNDQKSSRKKIYEGERRNCKFNTLLGELLLYNLPPGKAGSVEMDNTFCLDEDGILTVEASTRSNGQTSKAVVTLKEYRLSQHKIKSSFADAKRFEKEDELFVNFMKYLVRSKMFAYHILYDLTKILNYETRQEVIKLCDEFLFRFDDADNTVPDANKFKDLKTSFQAFKRNVGPLIQDVITVVDETPTNV